MPEKASPTQSTEGERISRRRMIWGGLAVGAFAGLGAIRQPILAAGNNGSSDQPTPWFHEAYAKVTGGRPVEARLVKINLPQVAENGNMVPFALEVESPMTASDHVRSITILSPLNPQAFIASFEFSPASGAARVQGRMRLAKTQDVLIIAELSNGQLVSGSRRVEVIVSGCGTG
ncbi:MAG: thiosulfate oxidation carrier protein SoxY [Hyphomicrobiaceae bacterium]|nr:thiosulfate oxidation carrier protein SoxY [Hyphomicrobiaceae bacterium]